MFSIPFTQYNNFVHKWAMDDGFRNHQRFGQAFFNFAELHKMTPTPFLDKLYDADNETATKMLAEIIDYAN